MIQGQTLFLSLVDPKLLKGYTVEFLTGVRARSSEVADVIERLGRQRGIRVIVNRKPFKMEEVLMKLCSSKGIVHYALNDANPRAVYEAFMGGLPAIISKESNVPKIVQKQKFVVMASSRKRATFNEKFTEFMKIVNDRVKYSVDEQTHNFFLEEMEEGMSLFNMCVHMGLCKHTRSREM